MAVESGKKVMVGIDDSASSFHTLNWVLQNLQESIKSSGNPLFIFMAQPFPSSNNFVSPSLASARMYCPISATSGLVNSVQEKNKVVSLMILEKAKSICASFGVNAEVIAETGDPKEALCDAVQKHNISLLIVGDQEVGKIKRALVWSVSNYCVHNAKCPVLVVKTPAA